MTQQYHHCNLKGRKFLTEDLYACFGEKCDISKDGRCYVIDKIEQSQDKCTIDENINLGLERLEEYNDQKQEKSILSDLDEFEEDRGHFGTAHVGRPDYVWAMDMVM